MLFPEFELPEMERNLDETFLTILNRAVAVEREHRND